MKNDTYLTIYYPPKKGKIRVPTSKINDVKSFFEEENVTEKLYPDDVLRDKWHIPFIYSEKEKMLVPDSLNNHSTSYRICKQQKGKQMCGFVENEYIPCEKECNYTMFIERAYNFSEYVVKMDKNENLRVVKEIYYDKKTFFYETIEKLKRIHEKGYIGKLVDAWILKRKTNMGKKRVDYVYVFPSYAKKLDMVLLQDTLTFASFVDIFLEAFSLIFDLHQLGYISSQTISLDHFAYNEKNKLIFASLPPQQHMEDYIQNKSCDRLFMNIANSYPLFMESCVRVLKNEKMKDKKERLLEWFKYFLEYMPKIKKSFEKKLEEIRADLAKDVPKNVQQLLSFEKEIMGPLFSSFKEEMLQIYKTYNDPILFNHQKYFLKPGDEIMDDLKLCMLPKEKDWSIHYNIEKEDPKNPSDKKFLSPTYFGSGAFGSAYKGCRKKEKEQCGFIDGVYIPCGDCEYAVKITRIEENMEVEQLVEIYKKASEKGLCSPLYDWWKCENTGKLILITDVYEKPLLQLFQDETISILQKCAYLFRVLQMIQNLHQAKIVHRDIHFNNIMVDKKGKPFFIDMDLSAIIKEDAIPLNSIDLLISDCRGFLYGAIGVCQFMNDRRYFNTIANYFLDIIEKDYEKYFFDQEKKEFSFDEVMQKEKEVIDKITKDFPIPPMKFIQAEVKKGLLPSLEKYFA